jgi:predicted house-cleaning NTP pyrophosphatase (Maf/HAM1 superfamily)
VGGTEAVSAPPAPPIVLASTSPQRRAILEQLGIPFDVV